MTLSSRLRIALMTIAIKTDKNGRTRATYWSTENMRNLPIKLADAELFIATGQADLTS